MKLPPNTQFTIKYTNIYSFREYICLPGNRLKNSVCLTDVASEHYLFSELWIHTSSYKSWMKGKKIANMIFQISPPTLFCFILFSYLPQHNWSFLFAYDDVLSALYFLLKKRRSWFNCGAVWCKSVWCFSHRFHDISVICSVELLVHSWLLSLFLITMFSYAVYLNYHIR